MPSASHYDILGLPDLNASTEAIKRAYKSAALRCHPDKNGGDVSSFVLVNRAFETLSDPSARLAYDAALTARRRQVVVSDEIELEDMDVHVEGGEDEDGAVGLRANEASIDENDTSTEKTKKNKLKLRKTYSCPCRCGDRHELISTDLHDDFDFVDVPCASCSSFVRVRYGKGDAREG
jgi:diphthamide biosynthesis protein 4